LQAGFKFRKPRLKRLEASVLLLGDRQQLDDHLLDDERRLFPAVGIKRQSFGQWDRSHHSGHPRGKHLVSPWVVHAAVIAQTPEDFQQKIQDEPRAVILHPYPLNPYPRFSCPW
jgi:hypothetical protein